MAVSAVPRGLKPHYQATRSVVQNECTGRAAAIGCDVRNIRLPNGGQCWYCWPVNGFDWELIDPPVSGSLAGLLEQLRDITQRREVIGRPASTVRQRGAA